MVSMSARDAGLIFNKYLRQINEQVISSSSSIDEVRRAYRCLAKKFHPDINKSPEAGEIMKKINNAYEALNDFLEKGGLGAEAGRTAYEESARRAAEEKRRQKDEEERRWREEAERNRREAKERRRKEAEEARKREEARRIEELTQELIRQSAAYFGSADRETSKSRVKARLVEKIKSITGEELDAGKAEEAAEEITKKGYDEAEKAEVLRAQEEQRLRKEMSDLAARSVSPGEFSGKLKSLEMQMSKFIGAEEAGKLAVGTKKIYIEERKKEMKATAGPAEGLRRMEKLAEQRLLLLEQSKRLDAIEEDYYTNIIEFEKEIASKTSESDLSDFRFLASGIGNYRNGVLRQLDSIIPKIKDINVPVNMESDKNNLVARAENLKGDISKKTEAIAQRAKKIEKLLPSVTPIIAIFERDTNSIMTEMSNPLRNRDPRQVVAAIRRIEEARRAALENLEKIKAA